MKNPGTWLIIACVIIGLLIAGCIWLGYGKYSYKKLSEDWQMQYAACMNAPVDTIVELKYITVLDTLWRTPKVIHDTVHDSIPAKWCEKYFADKYVVISGKDTGVVNYAIAVKDCEAKIKFPSVRLPHEIITITDRVDTCIAKPLNHYGVGIHLMGNSIYKMPNFDAEFFYTIKNRYDLSIGGEVNAYHGEVYIKFGGRIYLDHLKKKK